MTSGETWERYRELFAKSPAIQVIEYILGHPKILEWVHSVGVVEDPILRSIAPPIPPFHLRAITATPELPLYLWTGLVEAAQIVAMYRQFAEPSETQATAVLDFGCGNGRLTRFLAVRPDLWQLAGCDVHPGQVQWCRENLDADLREVGADPPTPYGSRTFHLVYCLSVFTHFPEARARAWLREIGRILRPNGLLILTTHGRHALRQIERSTTHQNMFRLSAQAAAEMGMNLGERGFTFVPYERATRALAQAGTEYGNAFADPDYIRIHWGGRDFELLEHLAGGLRGWQDIVVLRRKVIA